MRWIIGLLPEISAGILFLIPVLLLIHHYEQKSRKQTFFCLLFGSYLIAVLCFIGFPNIRYIRFEPNLNLIPFLDMRSAVVLTVLNVILFIPMGIMLPLFWSAFRKFRYTLVFSFLASLIIEISQLFSFRATDIDDLITNTLGACIGYVSVRILSENFRSKTASCSTRDLALICGSCVLIMFFFQPFLYPVIYDFFF